VVAILVGTAIGWAFDRWVGTRPWGMIVMFFLGTATGMVNVWRAVTGAGMAVGYRQQQDAAAPRDREEDED
jgi:ATP synthase protein I